MSEKKIFKKTILPIIIVIYTVVLVLGSILALNYGLADKFEANEKAKLLKLPKQVLSSGTTFSLYPGELVVGVSECFVANNDAGIVTISNMLTKEGELKVLVGINNQGLVTGVSIIEQGYAEGAYAKVANQEYLKAYIGKSQLTAKSIKEDLAIDEVPGAEDASNSVYLAVKLALSQYEKMYPPQVEKVEKKAEEKEEKGNE